MLLPCPQRVPQSRRDLQASPFHLETRTGRDSVMGRLGVQVPRRSKRWPRLKKRTQRSPLKAILGEHGKLPGYDGLRGLVTQRILRPQDPRHAAVQLPEESVHLQRPVWIEVYLEHAADDVVF